MLPPMRSLRTPFVGIAITGALGLVTLATGCAIGDPQTGQALDEFDQAYGDLSGEFGNGKADLLGGRLDPCPLLQKLAPLGHDGTRMGLLLGVEGEGVLGPAVGFGGFDLVWDLFHQELTVSRYAGAGLGVPGAGASVQAYAGTAFGFERGVSDWDGYFVNAGLELGLPLLKDFISLNPTVYATGVDENRDGFIGPSEIRRPPEGVYGFSVGVSLGFDLLPEVLPVGGSVTEGYWQPYKSAIRALYDELEHTRVLGLRRLHVRLVDEETGWECDPEWPAVDGDAECVIKFGDEGESYVGAALNTAYSICHVTGRCAVPLTWPLSAEALAIGAVRQSGLSIEEMCPASSGGASGGGSGGFGFADPTAASSASI
jgi:hypothetical protein